MAGQQFEYAFDDIGNRTSTKAGGDASGGGLRTANFTNNSLNQITGRDVPGTVDIIGAATAIATNVNVNDQMAYRRGEYYQVALVLNNTTGAIWQGVTNRAVQSGTTNSVTGNLFLPRTAEVFGYDLDGNQTNDGRWMMSWDAENRLIQVESLSSAQTASKRKVIYSYDWRGGMLRRSEYNGSSGSYVITNDLKFVEAGSRCNTELNATNNALVRSYLWGLDLSGSVNGLGGVGGLIAMRSVLNRVSFHSYDGNGNVTQLVDGANGTCSATCSYDPFGQIVRCTGLTSSENPFRFSTKRTDAATDWVHYEYRAYLPTLGRWANRDPIGESGGLPLYGFLGNNGLTQIDPLGLLEVQKDAYQNLIIWVGPCEIVRVVGHGNAKGFPRFFFPKSKTGSCPAAAGFVGCYADSINRRIQARAILIPGSPIDEGEGIWGGLVSPRLDNVAWNDAITATSEGMQSLARDWASNPCCKGKGIKIYDVDTDGKVTSVPIATAK